jgi:hypothetical protein
MKRVPFNVAISALMFSCGVVVSLLFVTPQQPNENSPSPVQPVPVTQPEPPGVTPEADAEVVFGGGRLRLVADEAKLKSERLHYDIDVRYPQILGSKEPHIQRLNQHFKEFATGEYEHLLHPTREQLQFYEAGHPEAFNTIDLDYEVVSANDSILSLYFMTYSYGIGAAHAVHQSFTINYDLVSGKELKLADLFKPRAKHLQFISRFCEKQLAGQENLSLLPEGLTPVAENFDSWNLTATGIRFNFDACQVFGCSAMEKSVEIPFSDLKSMLSARALSISPISSVVRL